MSVLDGNDNVLQGGLYPSSIGNQAINSTQFQAYWQSVMNNNGCFGTPTTMNGFPPPTEVMVPVQGPYGQPIQAEVIYQPNSPQSQAEVIVPGPNGQNEVIQTTESQLQPLMAQLPTMLANQARQYYASMNQYGANPYYASMNQYGANPYYANQNQYGSNPYYANQNQYGSNPYYANQNQYGSNPYYANMNQYGTNPYYANQNQYGSNPYYANMNGTSGYGQQGGGFNLQSLLGYAMQGLQAYEGYEQTVGLPQQSQNNAYSLNQEQLALQSQNITANEQLQMQTNQLQYQEYKIGTNAQVRETQIQTNGQTQLANIETGNGSGSTGSGGTGYPRRWQLPQAINSGQGIANIAQGQAFRGFMGRHR